MTKKDFELIASVIKIQKSTMDKIDFKILVNDMMDILADKNPRFDRDKFLLACGVEKQLCSKCLDNGLKNYNPCMHDNI